MATKVITITVTYDDAFEVPADKQVKQHLTSLILDSLLTFDIDESVVDDWKFEIKTIY